MSKLAGTKRKEAPNGTKEKHTKKPKTTEAKAPKPKATLEHFPEASDNSDLDGEDEEPESNGDGVISPAQSGDVTDTDNPKAFKLDGNSSAEAHAKQRVLAKERKAAKPNADSIARSKKIWERLRRKSHVPREERKELVNELFTIITGRVREFVFKHDSVRVIQCALKYANPEQRKNIVKELQTDLRSLAESRYGKFLVAKMVVEGDAETRNLIVPEFYGHVKRLINHPEASWIVDDIYRQIATKEQKATMLREWYGAEFALFQGKGAAIGETAELAEIIKMNPEKRSPILQYLHQMINSLIQKKMTGFTMLHDAMLQYFLALTPGSEEQRAFLEEMMGDIDKETEGGGGDLYKNLSFTKSGSRLVCLALAYGTAKDRKTIFKIFKDTIDTMAFDQYAKLVLVTGLEVTDDTTMTTRAVFREILGEKLEDEQQRFEKLEAVANDLNARQVLLLPMVGPTKWLVKDHDKAIFDEVYAIRQTSSKKAPELRRKALVEYLSTPLLTFVQHRVASLATTTTGCQFVAETLLACTGDAKDEAKTAVAQLAAGDPTAAEHLANSAAAGRMFKTLVLGGAFDPATKSVQLAEPRLEFTTALWPIIKPHTLAWATSASSFVVVALTESEDVDAKVREEVMATLKKGKKALQAAAGEKPMKGTKTAKAKGNAGARMLLQKL
nr:hypothetical protein B0A51_17163 [Rachicladosporium sp. CCFEE 5018]